MKKYTKNLILLVFVLSNILFAIRVSPGVFTATGIPVGSEKDFGIDLTVYNASETQAKYRLSLVSAEEIKLSSVEGYEPLPDLSWFYFEGGDTIIVPPNSHAGHRIKVHFPNRPDLYNRHFVVQVSVKAISSTMFNTVVVPTYFLETESNNMYMANDILFLPSVIEAENGTAIATIVNGSNESKEVELQVFCPDSETKGLSLDNSRGYWWIKDGEAQIQGDKLFSLKAGERREIEIKADATLSGEFLLHARTPKPIFCRIILPLPKASSSDSSKSIDN